MSSRKVNQNRASSKRPSKKGKNSEAKQTRIQNKLEENYDIFQEDGYSEFLNFKLNIKKEKTLNEAQKQLLEISKLKESKIIFVSGPAGTGKTWTAILAALESLNAKASTELIYIRNAVESSSNTLGFLPGDLNDKIFPYMEPLIEKLEEHLPHDQIKTLQQEQRIQMRTTGFLRGVSWENKVVVVDEAQNLDLHSLQTVMTRIGEGTKLFLCADPMQSDIKRSGYQSVFNLFNSEHSEQAGIFCFEFTEEEIVRSEIVKFIIKTFKSL